MNNAVMVTTKHRGVFFGYREGGPELGEKDSVVLNRARMCVYWDSDMKGVLGLASSGPSASCRVSQALTEPATFYDVTAVFDVGQEAAGRWEKGPWV